MKTNETHCKTNSCPICPLSDVERSLLGALEMLTQISKGQSYSALEYITRLDSYRDALREALPQLARDPYYSRAAFDVKPQRETCPLCGQPSVGDSCLNITGCSASRYGIREALRLKMSGAR